MRYSSVGNQEINRSKSPRPKGTSSIWVGEGTVIAEEFFVSVDALSGALTLDGDFVDKQESESRGGNANRYPIETGEIAHKGHRKRDSSEQRTSDVWSDLSDDKGVPMEVLKSEILTEGTNDHEQENANGDLSNPQFR